MLDRRLSALGALSATFYYDQNRRLPFNRSFQINLLNFSGLNNISQYITCLSLALLTKLASLTYCVIQITTIITSSLTPSIPGLFPCRKKERQTAVKQRTTMINSRMWHPSNLIRSSVSQRTIMLITISVL